MVGQIKKFWRVSALRLLAALVLVGVFPAAFFSSPALGARGDRALNLFFTQTGETENITFRREGRYDQSGLSQLNRFLRDWRRNEPARMDPALFDLVWQVYQDVGATGPIHVVSAYRSPQTNEMLRSRSSAVAKNSRHIQGQALDFFIPGVPIAKLREAAMRRQVGGVGYYPTAGNPFVHLDTGSVRAWPRMTRAQLRRLFPNGRTLHLPSDGVPLSNEGRRYATAEWNKCNSVPCSGSVANTAPGRNETSRGSGRTLFDLFFGNNNDQESVPATRVASTGPSQRQVTSVPVSAPPIPAPRAAFLDFPDPLIAPIPAQMPPALLVATRRSAQSPELAPSGEDPNRPRPRILLSPDPVPATMLTAYAPTGTPEPDAQRALQILIERRNSAQTLVATLPVGQDEPKPSAHPLPAPALRGSITTASIGGMGELGVDRAAGLFDATWDALINAQPDQLIDPIVTGAISPRPQLELLPVQTRPVRLSAPDLEHVQDALVSPTRFSGLQFAVLFEPDEADFNPATELGPLMGQIRFEISRFSSLQTSRFTLQAPQLLAAL